jgi:hypothetical protein
MQQYIRRRDNMMQMTPAAAEADKVTVDALRAIMARTGLTYSELASPAGVSPATVRAVLLLDRLPDRSHARAQLRRFVEANITAAQRVDVRFV